MMSALQWLMSGVFALSAALQFNDTDPGLWVMVYATAALVCLGAALQKSVATLQRPVRVAAAALATIALAWALALAPQVIGRVSFFELFEDIRMKSAAVEYGREMGGLLIVGVWMLITAWPATRRWRDNANERP